MAQEHLKILHVIRSVDPKGGGPIEAVRQFADEAAKHGVVSEILSIDPPNEAFVKATPVTVHAMGKGLGGFGYNSRVTPWLKAHRKDYDAVIVHGLWAYHAFATWRALHGTDTPYLVYPHGMLDPWFARTYPFKHLKKWLYWPWADYRVVRDASLVLFTCEEERRLAKDSFWLYRANERVVKFGIAGAQGDGPSQIEAFYQKFPHLREKDALLFLARVHPKKGPDLLVKAFAEVRKALPHDVQERAHLVMAGPDDHAYAEEIKALIRSLGIEAHVTWTGMVRGDLKWGALRSASAFVLTSHQENFGIAVAEALSAHTPVLITRSVNIWREISNAGAGLFCEDTVEDSVKVLKAWYALSPREQAKLREAARPCFDKEFHILRATKSQLQSIEAAL